MTTMHPGDRFGRLVLLSMCGFEACGNIRWRVRCDCGCEFEVAGNNLRNGHTKSCGCLRKEMLHNGPGRHKRKTTPGNPGAAV